MPRYVCHKVVFALKLVSIEPGAIAPYDVLLTPENQNYESFRVTKAWANARMTKGYEDDPGYYVVYEDGYTSWSPTETFEKGYTLLASPPDTKLSNVSPWASTMRELVDALERHEPSGSDVLTRARTLLEDGVSLRS